MSANRLECNKHLRIAEVLYLSIIALSFCLLILSRAGEGHTVWEVLHPAFVPLLFVATSLLIAILFASKKITLTLLFIIVHSILIHSLSSIVFPAGDISGQQMALGRIRPVYDNAIIYDWPPGPGETVQSQIYRRFRGINFQAALSVVFARMLSTDLLWIHLFLVPVLWGVFTPIAAYLTTNTVTKNEKVAVLGSLLLSAFPYAIYFGAISVANSLGFIFFFYSLYFMVKNLDSKDAKTTFLMFAFSSVSLLSHNLTGIMSFSLLFLSLVFKSYKAEKSPSLIAKVSLAIPFLFSTSLLPISFIYLRFFRPGTFTAFSLNKFYELPLEEIVGLFLIGELTYRFSLETILLTIIGPAIAFLYMIYRFYKMKKNPTAKSQTYISFLFAAFLMILIDYRILKLFMEGLPLNPERLWVFRDFIAVPFVALAVYAAFSSLKAFLKTKSLPFTTVASLKAIFKSLSRRRLMQSKHSPINLSNRLFTGLLFFLNLLLPFLLAGWITASLTAAYPQVAPLQTTSYELEAVRYIEEYTQKKYVVIGDSWTIFAGERIVGINNPRAYYFAEYNETGYDLFLKMKESPSPQWMLLAMNYTDTTVAYFIITKEKEWAFQTRLGEEEYNHIVQQAQQNNLQTYKIFYYEGEEKLRVFYYKKSSD